MSPISSRNSVPPSASSNFPARSANAPVKLPFMCPNSSLSISSVGIAAQFTSTKGPRARGESVWMARATSSLPVPFSPVMRTRAAVGENGDRKSTRLNSSHLVISYAVFCLKKKTKITRVTLEVFTEVMLAAQAIVQYGFGAHHGGSDVSECWEDLIDTINVMLLIFFFFFNATATTEIYTLSLHDALPISGGERVDGAGDQLLAGAVFAGNEDACRRRRKRRSEEHTSELQSPCNLVCRLLLEKKNQNYPCDARSLHRSHARRTGNRTVRVRSTSRWQRRVRVLGRFNRYDQRDVVDFFFFF